ncbi:LysR family transcriptional regulator [Mannheimia varigena]|uniref:LysR family transcriptional regulator n=1 Tax=Mannheimia varigena TaxID=85404 RepID=UPI000DBF0E1A|nr:LysR family transcriptional regulator [Mannheimia varigena]AWW33502.1 LysR family transcriptional regulator [Mannheimia varigena]
MDRIEAIRIFLTITETGSFTATADKLELSKPMVSRAVAMLEEWFNARLLQRTTRKVSLTEAGQQAVEYCQKIANLTENIEQDFLARSGELSGTLRIAAAISFGGSHLVAALQAFMQLHPKVSVQLQLSDQKQDLLDERIDLALRFTHNPDVGLVARKLVTAHSLLVATPAYLAQYGTPNKPEDLVHHRYLSHANVNRKSWKFYRDGQEMVLELISPFCVNDTNALLNATMADGGIAMLPSYMLTEQIKQGHLQPLLTDWQLPIYPLYALYPTRHHLPLTVRALVDFLAEYFADQRW